MKIATTDEEINSCFAVMKQLRPLLEQHNWLATIRGMEGEGYRLSYLTSAGKVVAVAGYYLCHKLAAVDRLFVGCGRLRGGDGGNEQCECQPGCG